MAKEHESGELLKRTRAPEANDMAIRLALAERAIADASIRIGELTRAVAALSGADRRPAPTTARAAVVDADAVSPFALGFYHREFDKLGRPFRWTGKGNIFEIRLRLDRNVQWSFAMEVQPNPNVDAGALRAFVDYMEVPAAIDATGKVLGGVMPERLFSDFATLTFLLPNTFIPAQVNPSAQDNRTLGLIFYELRVSPEPPGKQAAMPQTKAAHVEPREPTTKAKDERPATTALPAVEAAD
jgi:hypothetical protein